MARSGSGIPKLGSILTSSLIVGSVCPSAPIRQHDPARAAGDHYDDAMLGEPHDVIGGRAVREAEMLGNFLARWRQPPVLDAVGDEAQHFGLPLCQISSFGVVS